MARCRQHALQTRFVSSLVTYIETEKRPRWLQYGLGTFFPCARLMSFKKNLVYRSFGMFVEERCVWFVWSSL